MFPLNDPTIFSLVLAGVALLSAVAFRFGWKVRAPLLLMALALPAVFYGLFRQLVITLG